MSTQTLFEKIWRAHVVEDNEGSPPLIYVDLHLVHEVTSAQAFEGLRITERGLRRPGKTICTVDHNVPTWDRLKPITDSIALQQIETLQKNAKEFGIKLFDINDPNQGIVHIIGPELGYTQPGQIIVCGDSHTSTHGAFGALAFGIGTSEVEHVMATQCLLQEKPKTMEIAVKGDLPFGVTPKDLILGVIGQIGIDGANGHVIEYTGKAIKQLSMESRMTICNMPIEGGARAGLIGPDATTFDYVKGRRYAPSGKEYQKALEYWHSLPTDDGAVFDKVVEIEATHMEPFVTWGTNPGMVVGITGRIPELSSFGDATDKAAAERALEYMGLEPGDKIEGINIDRVFLGSCTNARIEDLRSAANVIKGKKVNSKVYAMVVPGSTSIKKQAELEGLDRIFQDAGFDWREAGCSMCLGMNPDVLDAGERCASTSNRNFEGRQGKGGRTHLVSPQMAAAAAVAGHFVDIRDWE